MNKNKIIVIVIVFVVIGILAGGGYYLWKNHKDNNPDDGGTPGGDGTPGGTGGKPHTGPGGQPPADKTGLNAVKANLGGGKIYKDALSATFNGGKYEALFYTNGRIIIMDTSTKSPIRRGNYSNGGKTLVMDNGVQADSGSVWKNLQDIVK